ncbi:hypothetical protein [Nostoc sp. KVJ3]
MKTLESHTSGVYFVTFSPDGLLLVTDRHGNIFLIFPYPLVQ